MLLNKMDFTKLRDYLDSVVKDGRVPGVDCIVYKEHEMVFRYFTGMSDIENKKKMQGDELYLIFSMTAGLDYDLESESIKKHSPRAEQALVSLWVLYLKLCLALSRAHVFATACAMMFWEHLLKCGREKSLASI